MGFGKWRRVKDTAGRALEEHSRQKVRCVQRLHVQGQVARGQPQEEVEAQRLLEQTPDIL